MARIDELCPGFSGYFVHPADDRYDALRRVWNGMIDRRPAVIARCANDDDVAACVRAAAELDIPLTVRGGGHNVGGTAVADGALLLDLSLMRGVSVDPERRTATVQGGALLSDVDSATAAHGLACPAGVVSRTGFGGLALGGGYGWLARRWGLTCDHIMGADVVLADGTSVRATDVEHADLLWALRGGGGNFGVVTRFHMALRDAPPVFHRRAVYLAQDALPALLAYRDFAEKQTDDHHAVLALRRMPDEDSVPPVVRGRAVVAVTVAWFGTPEAGPAMTDDLFAARPVLSSSRHTGYLDLQSFADFAEPAGNRYYTRSCYLKEFSPEAMALLLTAAAQAPSTMSAIDFEYLGGAISDGSAHLAAFPHRRPGYMCSASAQWLDPADDEPNVSWSRHTVDGLAPWQDRGGYVNYLPEDARVGAEDTYGTPVLERLRDVKRRYDPQNRFHRNHNIRP
jgi:FAD/FMN-containing dehydrogenase